MNGDCHRSWNLRARLYGFDRPVKVVPPEPGRFMDEQLEQLGA